MNELPYFCHICMTEIYVNDRLECPNCGNDFIELVNPANPPHEGYRGSISFLEEHGFSESDEERFRGRRFHGIFGRIESMLARGFARERKGRARNDRIATDRRNYAIGPEIDDVVTRLLEEKEHTKDPATPEERRLLKKVTLGNEGTCTVCLLPLEEGEDGILFGCMHKFHEPCADAWLEFQSICPNCRVHINPAKASMDGAPGPGEDFKAE